MKRQITNSTYLSLVYLFLYIPIAIVVWLSFNNARYSLLWHGFTWNWYQQLLQDSDLIQVAINSLLIGIISATFATVIGTIAAITLFRYRFLGKKLLNGFLFIMIIIPDIVIAISLLLLYRAANFPLGFWSLLLSHITFSVPFVFITVNARLTGMNHHILEAARDLGAKEYRIFTQILLPLLLPALLSGWLLSFTLSLDNVIISYFVTGPDFEILPLKIYSMVRLGVSPEVNALSTVLLVLTLVTVGVTHFLMRKKV